MVYTEHEAGCHGVERIQALEESIGSNFILLCMSYGTQAKSRNFPGLSCAPQNRIYNTCHFRVWEKSKNKVRVMPNKATVGLGIFA